MGTTFPPFLLVHLLRTMVRIRIFEERTADLLLRGEIRCPTHLYIGQEAIATGVCAALDRSDYILGTHRSHGHFLAKGGSMRALMAEMFGKKTGCAYGRGGSMHLIAREVGFLGSVPMVAATIPIAVGSALASTLLEQGRVAVSFFGDGATEEGEFHESLNFAALWKLPVLFVCENNFYSTHMPLHARQPTQDLTRHALAHAIPGVAVDGNDVVAVYTAAHEAVQRARAGLGPTLLVCNTYRWRGHVGPHWDLDKNIRPQKEVEAWMARCPIHRLETALLQQGLLTPQERDTIYAQAVHEVEDAVAFARHSPFPDPVELPAHLFTDRKTP
ncbi:MAG: thiamine pyrophosphate-dependent dehydrogenase E1 component subunit alpha [Dehalococcoidia bacterium]|nr:thiamine pyrophosphate-dependent dehydrogenase E1 component subunit alpha [Dehalococcoidia bacterium]MDW8119906.1 thiamine pyrophosphate-dependent dehydrogenase E1 component subunit alpha [Chloroflexota bacterium]